MLRGTSPIVVVSLIGVCATAGAQVTPGGTYQHAIPIDLPVIPSGVVPKLALRYDSGGGNGPLGVGWRLDGLSSITRVNNGDGIRYEGNDTYAGPSGRLVRPGGLSSIFHAETEDWVRYEPQGRCGDGPCSWRVLFPDGQVAQYGGIAVVWDSEHRGVRTWGLSWVSDTRGNRFDVIYSLVDGELLPALVFYDSGAVSGTAFVSFDWEARPDTNTSYIAGSPSGRTRRLAAVRVLRDTARVREYRLGYDQAPGSLASRLRTVGEVGNDGVSFQRTWSATYDGGITYATVVEDEQSAAGVPHFAPHWLIDVNGDGRDDLVSLDDLPLDKTGCLIRVRLRQASTFGPTVTTPAPCAVDAAYLWPGDYNGDGRSDLAWREARVQNGELENLTNVKMFLGRTDGTFTPQTWGPTAPWGDGKDTYPGDFDGDGRTDLATRVSSTDTFTVRISTGFGFAAATWAVPPGDGWGAEGRRWVGDFDGDRRSDVASAVYSPATGWNLVIRKSEGSGFARYVFPMGWDWQNDDPDLDTLVGDFNGDGKTDLVSRNAATGAVALHLVTGRGVVTVAVPNDIFLSEDKYRRGGDFDGDGRTDFVECTQAGGTIIYSTGAGFRRVTNTPISDGACQTDLITHAPLLEIAGDLDGDGVTDTASVGYGSIYVSRHLVPRGLLTAFRDGYPMAEPVVEVAYQTAAQTDTAIQIVQQTCGGGNGPVCGNPAAGPRHLVTSLTTHDGRGGLYRTEYTFWNGRVFPGRPDVAAYLGFQTMVVKNAGTGVYTRSTYLQVKPFQGQTARSETFIPSGDPIEQSVVLFFENRRSGYQQLRCDETGCVVDASVDLAAPRQVRATGEVSITYEYGVPLFEVRRDRLFDAYGNAVYTVTGTYRANVLLHGQTESAAYLNQTSGPRAIGVVRSRQRWVSSPADPFLVEEMSYDGRPPGQIGDHVELTLLRRREGGPGAAWEETSYAWDAFGNLVRETDPRGQSTTHAYSSDGRELVTTITPAGRVDFVRDHRTGVPLEEHVDGRILIAHAYDVFERPTSLVRSILASGQVLEHTTFEGPPIGPWERVCDALGAAGGAPAAKASGGSGDRVCVTITRDAIGREIRRLTPHAGGEVAVDREYGPNARLARVSEPYLDGGTPPAWTVYEHDVLERVTRVTAPDGSATRISYNPGPAEPGAVRSRQMKDALGRVTTLHEDDRGLPFLVDSSGARVRFAYDALGRTVRATRPGGSEVKFTYDAAGRRASVFDPDAGESSFTYYANPGNVDYGRLLTETRPGPNGGGTVTSAFSYDGLGRLVRRIRSDGAMADYSYDPTAVGGDRLDGESWSDGALHVDVKYGYDEAGRLINRRQVVSGELQDGTPLSLDATFDADYDEHGRVTVMRYPDGHKAIFERDRVGAVTRATLGDAEVVLGPRDARGNIEETWFGPALRVDAYAPANGRLDRREVFASDGSRLFGRSYARDATGNPLQVDDLVTPDLGTSYDYDDLGRLRQARREDGTTFDYAFDAASNLTVTTVFRPDGQVERRSRSFTAGTHLLDEDGSGERAKWSDGGNLLSLGGREYGYDGDAQLRDVFQDGKLVESHASDAARHEVVSVRRVGDDSVVVRYATGGLWELSQELDHGQVRASSTTSNLVADGQLVASVSDGDRELGGLEVPTGIRYPIADELGSAALALDKNGDVVASVVYSPTGEVDPARSRTAGEVRLFAGLEVSPASGLLLAGTRRYDPALGIFTTPDSLVSEPLDPLDWNPFLYARGNPMRYVDPTGHFPIIPVLIGIGVGFIIGGTEGGILADPGAWLEWDYLSEHWNWWTALAGGALGGATGYGWAALGGISGSVFGVKVGALAQSMLLGGLGDVGSAYGDGERNGFRLAGHFAIGAAAAFISRTGFLGLAWTGMYSGYSSFHAFLMYGAAMLADSVVTSGMRLALDDDAPLEFTFYIFTVSYQSDGRWTRRWSFGQTWRYIVGGVIFSGDQDAGERALTNFEPMHRDRIYQALSKLSGQKTLVYTAALFIEQLTAIRDAALPSSGEEIHMGFWSRMWEMRWMLAFNMLMAQTERFYHEQLLDCYDEHNTGRCEY